MQVSRQQLDPGENEKTGKEKFSAPKQIRTFTDDVAELIRDKKMSSKDLAHIDPRIARAVHEGPGVAPAPKKDLGAGVDLPEPKIDPLTEKVKEMYAEANQKPPSEEKVLEVEEVDKSIEVQKVVQASQPKPEQKPVLEKPQPKPEVKPEPKPVVREQAPGVQRELTPLERLKQEEIQALNKIAEIQGEEKNIEAAQASLVAKKKEVQSTAEPLKVQEVEVEARETALWKEEAVITSPKEKQAIETKRWSLEDERQRIENERWNLDQQIMTLEKNMQNAEAERIALKKKEADMSARLSDIQDQEIVVQAEMDKEQFGHKLDEIKAHRAKLEEEWKALMEQKKKVENARNEFANKEKVLAHEIESINVLEHKAQNPAKVHEYESERWKKDTELREVEQREWKVGAEAEKVQAEIDELQKRSQDVLLLEKTTKAKIADLDALIQSVQAKHQTKPAP